MSVAEHTYGTARGWNRRRISSWRPEPRTETGYWVGTGHRAAAPPSLSRRSRIAENAPVWLSENDLCHAWQSLGGGNGSHRLRTIAGADISVLQTGARNTGDGPDFLGAVIEVSAPGQRPRIVRGDVEMHLRAMDWFSHGHDTNPAFASVILQVVESAQGMTEVAGAPVLELRRESGRGGQADASAGDGLDALRQAQGAPRRRGMASTLDPLSKLDSLGDARLEERAAAMEGELTVIGAEQTLYEALFRGLGYTRNMTSFQETARLMPLETLRGMTIGAPSERDLVARLTGLLFGTARLLPSQRGGTAGRPALFEGADAGVRDAFEREAEAEWARHPGLESLGPASWQVFRVRPDNHPVRRMAAAVELMRRWFSGPGLPHDLRGALMDGDASRHGAARLTSLLIVPSDGYWSSRRDFGKGRTSRPSALLGRGRALDIIATAVLPFLLAIADFESDEDLERRVRQLYRVLPSPGESQAARHARQLMGTPAGESGGALLSARRYQGFLSVAGPTLNGERESLAPAVE